MNESGISTGQAIACLLYLFDRGDDANSIDRPGFAAYTPYSSLTGKQLLKERSDETHLSAKRFSA